MDQPNAADWLTAIGTVGTLAATVALFSIDRYQRRKRSDKVQAVLVSAWAEPVLPGDEIRVLKVVNHSNEPVYRVNIFMEDEYNRDPVGEVMPMAVGSETINTKYLSLLPPREQVEYNLERRIPELPGPRTAPRVYLVFSDRNGRRWARDFSGKISLKPRDNPELRLRLTLESIEHGVQVRSA